VATMRFAGSAVLIGAVFCTLVACGGSNSASVDLHGRDQHLAKLMVLRAADFPPGWHLQSEDNSVSLGVCLEPSGVTLTGTADAEFAPDPTALALSVARVFATVSDAQQAYGFYSSADLGHCIINFFKRQSGPAKVSKAITRSRSFPQIGDAVGAQRMVITLT